jgi:hypothetical protein
MGVWLPQTAAPSVEIPRKILTAEQPPIAVADTKKFLYVTTLSARADSFLSNSPLTVNAHWLSPSQESTSQDVSGCVLISVQNKSTLKAFVLALREFLFNLSATPRTQLTCPCWINFNKLCTGTLSLVAKDVHEAGPTSIGNRTGKSMVLEHPLDVQAFHRNQSMRPDYFQSSLVVIFMPLVGDVGMKNTYNFGGLASIQASLFLATHGALSAAQSRQLFFKKSWVLYDFSIRGGEKIFKAYVDTDRRKCTRRNVDLSEIAGQNYKPRITLALECDGLDNALDGPMNLAADNSDMLNAKSIAVQVDTITVSRKFYTVESILGLESWISWLLSHLHSSEKCDERFIQPTHRGLGRGKVQPSEVRINFALGFEPYRLFGIINASFFNLVSGLSLFKTRIIQPAVRFEHDAKLALLIGVSKQSEFVSSSHFLSRPRSLIIAFNLIGVNKINKPRFLCYLKITVTVVENLRADNHV